MSDRERGIIGQTVIARDILRVGVIILSERGDGLALKHRVLNPSHRQNGELFARLYGAAFEVVGPHDGVNRNIKHTCDTRKGVARMHGVDANLRSCGTIDDVGGGTGRPLLWHQSTPVGHRDVATRGLAWVDVGGGHEQGERLGVVREPRGTRDRGGKPE